VYISSLDGQVLDTNDAAVEFFGYDSKEELQKIKITDLYCNPEDRQKYIHLLREKEFVKEHPLLLKKKDGSLIHALVTTVPKKDENGNPVSFQGTVRDVTEYKQTLEKLRESEEKYRDILKSIEDGYFEVDIAGNLTFFNDAMCRIIGYSKKETLGMTYRRLMDAEQAKRVFHAFNWVYRTGNPHKTFDWELIRKDGSKRCVETSISLIKKPGGKPAGFQGILRDVSERKRIEEEKSRLEHRLRQAEKMEAIGTLAGGVAHDLNNILSGIVGYPDLLLMQIPQDSPLRKPILSIQESGFKASAIVNDLLSLARRIVIDYEPISMNTVVLNYLNSPEFKKMKSFYPAIEIKTLLEADLLNVLGSPFHLSKVIMNLVANAAEAIGEKGQIMISTANRHIDRPILSDETIEAGDYAVLKVSDNGIGIPSKDLKHIFEPFFTKKKMGKSGTGLGLSVVWGTVKDHKGFIDVQSKEGIGTAFTLYFPITSDISPRPKAGFSIKEYMGGGQFVLVVDDLKQQQELAAAMLDKLGYSVKTVSSGEEALRYMQNNTVDLIILDMVMDPGIDGLETYRQILKLRPGQKAVIASGYSQTKRVKEALRLGAQRFIQKPYTIEKIATAVKEALEQEE
jgi:PAS domain S-box-containing protein